MHARGEAVKTDYRWLTAPAYARDSYGFRLSLRCYSHTHLSVQLSQNTQESRKCIGSAGHAQMRSARP